MVKKFEDDLEKALIFRAQHINKLRLFLSSHPTIPVLVAGKKAQHYWRTVLLRYPESKSVHFSQFTTLVLQSSPHRAKRARSSRCGLRGSSRWPSHCEEKTSASSEVPPQSSARRFFTKPGSTTKSAETLSISPDGRFSDIE